MEALAAVLGKVFPRRQKCIVEPVMFQDILRDRCTHEIGYLASAVSHVVDILAVVVPRAVLALQLLCVVARWAFQ